MPGPHHRRHHQGQGRQRGGAARRDRQDGLRFSRQSGGGADGSARSRCRTRSSATTTSSWTTTFQRYLFLATANYDDGIPATLYDRLETIQLSGYTFEEKEQIAKRHLLPKIARETGLKKSDVVFSPAALKAVIRFYTRESGVRDLERHLRKIYRKVARALSGRRQRSCRYACRATALEGLPRTGAVHRGAAWTGARSAAPASAWPIRPTAATC